MNEIKLTVQLQCSYDEGSILPKALPSYAMRKPIAMYKNLVSNIDIKVVILSDYWYQSASCKMESQCNRLLPIQMLKISGQGNL